MFDLRDQPYFPNPLVAKGHCCPCKGGNASSASLKSLGLCVKGKIARRQVTKERGLILCVRRRCKARAVYGFVFYVFDGLLDGM